MNNISFQGHTTLICNPKKFNEIAFEVARKSRNLKPGNKCTLVNNQIYTAKANDENLIVLIKDDKKGVLKYIPTNNEINNFIEEIGRIVYKLKEKSKKNLTAWIIGGSEIKSQNGENTIKTINRLADILCDRPDIDTSILACGKQPQENIIIHSKQKGLELTLEKPQKINLEEAFDIVELNNTEII